MHLNPDLRDEALASFSPLSIWIGVDWQTYILKPLQRHARVTLNEKQSYLFTRTLIGLKVYIVPPRIIQDFFFNSEMKKLIDVMKSGHKLKYKYKWRLDTNTNTKYKYKYI